MTVFFFLTPQPPSSETVVVCVDEAKGASLIKTGEVVERWEGVEFVVVSDFLAKGHKQLLVCYDTGMEQI